MDSGPAGGLEVSPSDHEPREAWRSAVDVLKATPSMPKPEFRRAWCGSLTLDGHAVRVRSLELGDVATAVLEVRSPGGDRHVHSVLVDSDPPGPPSEASRTSAPTLEAHLHVPVRPLAPASTSTCPSYPNRCSHRCRSRRSHPQDDTVRPVPAGRSPTGEHRRAPTCETTRPFQALAERLRRIDALERDARLNLLQIT